MIKAERNGILILGLVPAEMEHLKQGNPLQIPLADLGFPGAGIIIIPGESHEKLKKHIEEAGEKLKNMHTFDKGVIDLSKVRVGSKN